MRQRVPDEVTCAICGRHFDPSESRGWCPNPSCGEWQHPSFPIEGEGEDDSGSGGATLTKSCPNCGKEVSADTNFCTHCATQFDDDEIEEESEDDDSLTECPDCGADLSQIPSDQLSKCPICMFDLSPMVDSGDDEDEPEEAQAEPESAGATMDNCPNCGEDLTPIPADMRTVCPGCRVDLDESQEAAAKGDIADASAGGSSAVQVDADTTVDQVEGIGTGYKQRLAGIGIETVGDLVASDPNDISAETGISTQRISEWIDSVPVEPEDVGPTFGGPGAGRDTGRTGAQAGQTRGAGQQGGQAGGQQGGQAGGRGSQSSGGQSDPQPSHGRSHGSSGGESYGSDSGGRDRQPSTTQPETTDVQTATDTFGGGDDSDMMDTQITPPGDETMETKIQPQINELTLSVMGQEIPVTDGSTVGREVRRAMVEAGRSEEKAVYVHRKHVRIDQENGDFYLTRLGDNSLKVNGSGVDKGDRVPIDDGDDITFSDVVTASVSIQ